MTQHRRAPFKDMTTPEVLETLERIKNDGLDNRFNLEGIHHTNGNGRANRNGRHNGRSMDRIKLGGRQNEAGEVETLNGKKPSRFRMQINQGYYTIDSRWRDLKYYLTLVWPHPIRAMVNRLHWHWDPRLRRVADFPDHVDIEISGACNQTCPMCFRQTKFKNMNATHGLMEWDVYTRAVDECSKHGVYSIKLSWRGESSMHPQLVEMVKYAKERGIKEVAFLSNGMTLTPERFRQLAMVGLDWLSISFDGLGETYEAIRHPSKYDEALERLRGMKRVRDELGRGKPMIRVQSIWSAIKDNPGEYKRIMEPIADKINFIPDVKHLELQDHDPTFVCGYPWQRLTISWDGTVPLCIGDLKELYKLGRIQETSLYDIWHGEKMQHARNKHAEYDRLKLPACSICHQGRKATHMQDGELIPKKVGNIRL